MKIIRHIIRGAGYLEGFGHHPGTGMLFLFIVMVGLAGAQRGGWSGFIGGCVFSSIFFLPMYFHGCIERSKESDRVQKRLMKHIKG